MTGVGTRRPKVPHLYVDTNILDAVLESRHTSSVHLLDVIFRNGWECSTSVFGFMELFDINQDNKFVLNQLELGVHIKKAYKSLDQKNLSFTDLRQVSTNIQNVFSVKYPNIKFYDYGKINWDKALELKATANISAPDVIHLATAIEAGCDLLVTLDNFFKKEAKPYIEGCLPEQVEQVIRDLGFTL